MSEQEIYEGLMNWLRQSWAGLPESDALLPLMKATYTPEEASLLTGIPFQGRSLEDAPEAKDRVTVVEREEGRKELKNKNGKVSTVNLENCIGCGVCVYK